MAKVIVGILAAVALVVIVLAVLALDMLVFRWAS